MILIIYIVIIIGVLAGLLWLKQKLNIWILTRDFEKVFKNSQIRLPKLKIGSSYSWPTFRITFSTKEDFEFAKTNGLIDLFKNKMRTKYT